MTEDQPLGFISSGTYSGYGVDYVVLGPEGADTVDKMFDRFIDRFDFPTREFRGRERIDDRLDSDEAVRKMAEALTQCHEEGFLDDCPDIVEDTSQRSATSIKIKGLRVVTSYTNAFATWLEWRGWRVEDRRETDDIEAHMGGI